MQRMLMLAVHLALLCDPAGAQGMIGGFAVENSSGRPLRCIDVKLLDSLDAVVDSTQTRQHGLFQLTAPRAGHFRLRFSAGGLTDVLSEPELLEPESQIERQFRIPLMLDSATLAFIAGEEPKGRGTGLRFSAPPPRYPPELRRAGVQGDVVLAYTVEQAGTIDTATVLVLKATHALFYHAVREVLPRGRYRVRDDGADARCVLAVQPFGFRLRPY